jgi:hypothetical protein
MALEPVINAQPTPCNLPWPDHAWDDPDDDGHQCAGCGADSVWKCDPAAHNIGAWLREHDPAWAQVLTPGRTFELPEGRIHLDPQHRND